MIFTKNYRLTVKMVMVFLPGIIFLRLLSADLYAQTEITSDTLIEVTEVEPDSVYLKPHSAHRATIYSLILPGLGQAYNRKYWKIPIIYAGFGLFYYLIDYNNTEYIKWRDAYYFALTDDGTSGETGNEYFQLYGDNTDFLRARKDDARRYRDLNYIFAGIWYVLNVLDAAVDAHLFSWNVDDDLSIRWQPHIDQHYAGFKPAGGLKISMSF